MIQDLKETARSLRRAPSFTLMASTTLALGIGASVAASTYLDYLKRPSVEAPLPDQLRFVHQVTRDDPQGGFSLPDFRDVQASSALRPLGAWRLFSASFVGRDATRHAWGHAVSGDYFALFGARPALGRLIQPEDDREGAERVLVLGHHFWTERLGARPDVVGSRVLIDGRHPYLVIGVAAPRFQGEGFGTALYLPLGTAGWLPGASNRDANSLTVLGRLPDSTREPEALSRLASLARSLDASHPTEHPRRFDLVAPRKAQVWEPDDPLVRGAESLALTVTVLLLLGVANVSTLMLARATTRRREWAVRTALGASRLRLLRVTLLESVLLAGLGALAGLPLAASILRLLEVYLVGTTAVGFGDWSSASHLPLDGSLAAFLGIGLALCSAALCFGLSVALQVRTDLVTPLKAEGEGGGSVGSLRLGGRRALVASQAALATALLVVAGLATRSFAYLGSQALGFSTEHRLLAVVHVPAPNPGPAPVAASLLDDIRALPGVRAAGLVSRGPIHPLLSKGEVETGALGSRVAVSFNNISDGYFTALGVPLLEGRDFRTGDRADAARVAVVSRSLAESLWPGSSAIGRRFSFAGGAATRADIEVVGVAADSRQGPLRGPITPHVFLPRRLAPETRPNLVIHAETAIGEGLARLLRERYPDSSLIDLQPLEQQRVRSAADGRMNTEIAASIGFFGLVLAAVGVFGLVSFSVSRRFREFGIRLALGATGPDLVQGVLRDLARLLGAGALAGLALAYPMARLVESRLVGVSAADPWAYVIAAAALLGVGLAAGFAPARRAAAIEPLAALRRS